MKYLISFECAAGGGLFLWFYTHPELSRASDKSMMCIVNFVFMLVSFWLSVVVLNDKSR